MLVVLRAQCDVTGTVKTEIRKPLVLHRPLAVFAWLLTALALLTILTLLVLSDFGQ
jgi:hypothetical protein